MPQANPLVIRRPADLYAQVSRNPFAPDIRRPRGAKIEGPKDVSGLHRRGPRGFGIMGYTEPTFADLEKRAVSRSQRPDLTVLERIFLRELLRRGLREQIDFLSQLKIAGGRHVPGGYLPDFTILVHGPIAIEVDGYPWHSGLVPNTNDTLKASYEHALGFVDVLRIDEHTLTYDDLTQAWFNHYLGFLNGAGPATSYRQFIQNIFSGTYGPNSPINFGGGFGPGYPTGRQG